MKQSIGTIWITGLVITFMLIFVGYLTFMLSFSDTEKTKNDILSIIEKRNGITNINYTEKKKISVKDTEKTFRVDYGTLQSINLYLMGRMYKNKGYCVKETGETWYGVKELTKGDARNTYEEIKEDTKYYYCFSKITPSSKVSPAYYKIKVFYVFDLPIINAMSLPIVGKTNQIMITSGCEINKPGYNHNKNICPKDIWDKKSYEK